LYYLTPVAAVLMTLLFLTSDRIPFRQIEQQVGWKGELRLLPEITIIPDHEDLTSEERQRQANTMTSVDLDVVDSPDALPSSKTDVEEEREEEEPEVSEVDDFDIHTVETNREVPYSEDYVILRMVEPVYPAEELEKGIEGSVTVELFVNEQGLVEKASVLSALGPESFQESTLDAVKQFVFKAPIRDGKPSSMWIKFLVKFRMFGQS